MIIKTSMRKELEWVALLLASTGSYHKDSYTDKQNKIIAKLAEKLLAE